MVREHRHNCLLMNTVINVFILLILNLSFSIFITSNILIIQSFNKFFDLYTPNEISHLLDVRKLLLFNLILLFFCLMVLRSRFQSVWQAKILLFSTLTGIIFVLLFFLSIYLFWNQLFILFHQLLFPQGNWTFPSNSLLIQNFPERYWINSFKLFSVIFLIVSLAPNFILRLVRRHSEVIN
jgi:hypothetical protein